MIGGAGPAAPGDEAIARSCLAAAPFFLAAGLLACGAALPLAWLPGQLPLVLGCLALLPAATVWATQRQALLAGLAARDFARNARLTRLAAVSLMALLYPSAIWRLRHGSGTLATWDFAGPVLVSMALCLLVSGLAEADAKAWSLLHPQPWEVSERGSRMLAAGVPRDALLTAIRARWVAGGVLLAAALVAHGSRSPEQTAQTVLATAALAGTMLAGLVFGGLAARRRKTTHWLLTDFTVSPEVGAGWNRLAANGAIAALLATVLLLAIRVLDLAHLVLAGLVDDLLLPWLRRLPFDQSAGKPPSCSSCGQAGTTRPPVLPHVLNAPPRGGEAGIWRWLGAIWQALVAMAQVLLANWPSLAALLVLLVLGRRLLGPQRRRQGWHLLRALLEVLGQDLQSFLALLWRPGRPLLARARLLAGAAAARGARRLTRVRAPRLDGLSARQAVIVLYLAALDLAARRGHQRRPGQTPGEFARRLAADVPESDESIRNLTEAFEAVRYGGTPARLAEVAGLQRLWRSLRAALSRHRRRSGP